ncbi:MAG: hypothetical protein J6M18_01350 [Actinomycetaceae bacterium]|nr:hypothetical protein [Actinomycetaceae bacterium]
MQLWKNFLYSIGYTVAFLPLYIKGEYPWWSLPLFFIVMVAISLVAFMFVRRKETEEMSQVAGKKSVYVFASMAAIVLVEIFFVFMFL